MQIHFHASLLHQSRGFFTVISNHRTPFEGDIGNRTFKYDEFLERYRPSIRAYLSKRRVKKEEVWPKMRILPNEVPELQRDLDQQKLYPIKQQLTLEAMGSLFQAGLHRSSYIISRFTERYLKPMLDEYVAKVVICGRTVPLDKHPAYWNQREKIVKLYRTFFFGEPLTPLEREIEQQYLVQKQEKFMRWTSHPDNAMHRCTWTQSNQRCVELYKNWQSRPVTEFGDFRPIFEPLLIQSKLPQLRLIQQIDSISLYDRIKFEMFTTPSYQRQTKDNLQWIVEYNMVRMIHWCNSMEFLRLMRIPPDFQVQLAVIHFHGWLFSNFLKRWDTPAANHMIKRIKYSLNVITTDRIGRLSIKKKNDFQKNVSSALKLNLTIFDYHFNKSPLSKDDPYVKIDALIWSTVFLEKVERYGDEVYLFSDYAVKSYKMLQEASYEDWMTCMIEFDAYIADYNFKEKVQAINPPLPKEEYEAELQSDKKDKKYYYSHGLPGVVMPFMNPETDVKPSDIRKNNFMYRLMRMFKKYHNLDTYDYYNEVESKKKEQDQQKKTGWTTDEKAVNNIDVEFQTIQQIKRKIKK